MERYLLYQVSHAVNRLLALALACFPLMILAAGTSLGGCADRERIGLMRPRSTAQSVFSLGWTYRLMSSIAPYRNRANPIQGSIPEVDRAGNRIFVGSADQHIYCLRADTGRVIWRQDVGAAVRSQPLYMAETQVVFFGTDNGELRAIGADDSEQRWVYQAEGEIIHQPVIQGEALYITSADNTIHAIDWTNGESIWRHREERSAAEFEVTGFAGVAVSERVVFTGVSNGVVGAFDAYDGSEIWRRDLSEDITSQARLGGIPMMRDIDTTPVLGKRRVYVASYDAGVYAIDRESSAVEWREPSRGVVSLFGSGTTLFAAQAGEGVLAIDTANGRAQWRQRLGPATYYQPSIFRDLLIIPDSQRGITALQVRDGEIVHRYVVGSGAGGGAELIGSTAFLVSNGGVLASITLH